MTKTVTKGSGATAPLGTAFPDIVWVRLTSDVQTLRAAYSADGALHGYAREQEVHSADGGATTVPLRLAGSASPKIGLPALSGTMTQPPVVEAMVDWLELCPGGIAIEASSRAAVAKAAPR